MREIEIGTFITQVIRGECAVIDVRSESEFAEGTIPGSVNIPLFNDDERREIGILYKHSGKAAANDRGLELVANKLPTFVRALRTVPGKKMIFCWRGGMRSRTSATLLSLLEQQVYQLKGGYRAFRRWSDEQIRHYQLPAPLMILNGMTGTGKTAIIQALVKSGKVVALDIEQLAGHRGSIFGGIGQQPNNQRTFDALLLIELERIRLRAEAQPVPFLLMEGESKRIGKIVLPDFLWQAKQSAPQIIIELPLEKRVAHILAEYRPHLDQTQFLQMFRLIERRLHTSIAAEIRRSLLQTEYANAVRLLLVHYYDKRYMHTLSSLAVSTTTIRAEHAEDAVKKVENLLCAT